MFSYGPPKVSRDAVVRRIVELDETLQSDPLATEDAAMIVVGGSALLLRNQTDREVTRDIDALSATRSVRTHVAQDDIINFDVAAYSDCLPYNYEDRLEELDLGLAKLHVGTPSLEDLVVMKLYASRGVDDQDLTSARLLEDLDWDLLDRLVLSEGEARASIGADINYYNLVLIYEDYRDRYGPSRSASYEWPHTLRHR